VLAGTELTPREAVDVCFADGRIVSLGSRGAGERPASAREIDVRGKTVLPGLVDTHVHVLVTEAPPWAFRFPEPQHNLDAWLWSGVTTVFDMGGTSRELADWQARVASHEVMGPQIFFTLEPITAPGGHPIPAMKALLPWPVGSLLATTVPVVESRADAVDVVASLGEFDVEYVKIIHDELPPGAPRLRVDRLEVLIDEAHAAGLKAMVHIGSNRDALEAIEAGADHLVHGVYREAVSQELIAAARENGVSITYTVAAFDNTRRMAEGSYEPASIARCLSDPELVEAVSLSDGAQFAELDVLGDFSRGIASTEVLRDNVRRLHEAGVQVLVGTDSPIAAVFPGLSLHEELAFLASAGIPAETLVRRATVEGARLVRDDVDFGALEVGARADILVVDGDPLLDVAALREIVHVFAEGRQLERVPCDL